MSGHVLLFVSHETASRFYNCWSIEERCPCFADFHIEHLLHILVVSYEYDGTNLKHLFVFFNFRA